MVPYIFHYFQFNHTVTCFKCFSDVSQGYPVQMLILTGLLFGALLNALLYLLVLINPKKMNPIASYLFGGFASAEYQDVIIISLIASVAIIVLFLMQKELNYCKLVN